MESPIEEFSICAAILTDKGTVIRGHLHSDCVRAIERRGRAVVGAPSVHGFVTSLNRFRSWKDGAMRRFEPNTPAPFDPSVPEVCVCAAALSSSGKIVIGHRHGDCTANIEARGMTRLKATEAPGFITTRNRFVGRKEGRCLQAAAGVPSARESGYNGTLLLYSEDLY